MTYQNYNMKKRTSKIRISVIALLLFVFVAAGYFLYPPSIESVAWPDGKLFAFSIIDDTDLSTLENVRPVYDYISELGLRTTKTVWMLPTNDPD